MFNESILYKSYNFRSEETTELLDLSRLASEGSKMLVILKSYKTIYKEYEGNPWIL
jgi:hypothetical protein